MIDIISQHYSEFIAGLLVTMQICTITYVIGIVLGSLFAFFRYYLPDLINTCISLLATAIFSIPIIVVLFWLHYPLQYMLSIVVDPFYTTILALSLVLTLSVSEIVLNSMKMIDKEYIQSALLCGLCKRDIALMIQIPLLTRLSIPQVLTQMIIIMHASLFASLISVNEIFRVAQRINSDIYKPVEIYSILALFFLAICFSMFMLVRFFKKKFEY